MTLMLLSTLMLLQYEPCNKVGSGEAQAREEVLPVSEHALHAVHPAGFENAARQEHQNEAAALRNLQEEAVCLISLLNQLPAWLAHAVNVSTLCMLCTPLAVFRVPGWSIRMRLLLCEIRKSKRCPLQICLLSGCHGKPHIGPHVLCRDICGYSSGIIGTPC